MESAGLRHTPAGLPALRLTVAHTGPQREGGHQRSVEMETEVTAFGPVAEALARVERGRTLKLAGFIDRRSARDARLELHVTEFGIVEE